MLFNPTSRLNETIKAFIENPYKTKQNKQEQDRLKASWQWELFIPRFKLLWQILRFTTAITKYLIYSLSWNTLFKVHVYNKRQSLRILHQLDIALILQRYAKGISLTSVTLGCIVFAEIPKCRKFVELFYTSLPKRFRNWICVPHNKKPTNKTEHKAQNIP